MNILREKRGMTLVEVVVSVLLLSIVIVAMIGTVTQSSVFSKRVDRVYSASYIAQRRMEMIKRLDFGDISSAGETEIRVGADGNVDPDGLYSRTTEVTTDYKDYDDLTKVKVTVKKVQVSLDGITSDPDTGQVSYMGNPVVLETVFVDM